MRVNQLAHMTGPVGGLMLADIGTDVIEFEKPNGVALTWLRKERNSLKRRGGASKYQPSYRLVGLIYPDVRATKSPNHQNWSG